jgi:hypothetical protein
MCLPHQRGWKAQRMLGILYVAIALLWSIFTNSQGALSKATECWNVEPRNIDTDPSRVWDLADPQFLSGLKDLYHTHSVRSYLLARCT